MSEEKSSCIEDICYECCWYAAKIYTYIQEYLCCCICKKGIPYDEMENTSIIEKRVPCNFDYNFLAIEIKIGNKSYIFNDFKEYMIENKEFLKADFVYDYLARKKILKNINENSHYIISIMDNKSNFITLDKNSHLFLKKNKYEQRFISV